MQLCLEGYYDNTRFHRVIKDYLVQGGDPTGTGEGGRPPEFAVVRSSKAQACVPAAVMACAQQTTARTGQACWGV